MRADLHIHSVFSDGLLRPAELAVRVKAAGLSLFSITDHDSMDGCGEGAEAARAEGLRFVRGWEVSSYLGTDKIHVLGYGCTENEAYRIFREKRVEEGRIRAEKAVRLANGYFGTNVTMDDVEAYHVQKETPLHTMYVVRAFAKKLSADPGPLYGLAFALGGPAFVEGSRPTPVEAIEVIHASGGLAVLAHPGRIFCLTLEEMLRWRRSTDEREKEALDAAGRLRRAGLLDSLTEAGLDGIECRYTTHTVRETEEFLRYAEAHGLFATGGSDFHADGSKNVIGMPAFEPEKSLSDLLLRLEGSV